MSVPQVRKETVVAQTGKVGRYWPGKAPKYAEEEAEEAPVQITHVEDRRLARLAEADTKVERETAIARHRAIHEAAVVKEGDSSEDEEAIYASRAARRRHSPEVVEAEFKDEDDSDNEMPVDRPAVKQQPQEQPMEEEEDDDAIQARRERLRLLRLQREEEEELMDEEAEEGEEDEDEEYETDTSDEEDHLQKTLLKPKFFSKQERETILEKERLAAEAEAEEKLRQKKEEERKKESKQMVVQEVMKMEEESKGTAGGDDDEELPDTDDEGNEAAEYEKWKLRELKRIKRDKDEREHIEKEKLDKERRRNMTEAERREEDRRLQLTKTKVTTKWNFMQKYYHKGAYFQETDKTGKADDEIYNRDYSLPTLEDKFDKAALPAVLQVKNFGRSGRTKYTHLVDQDTTQFDSLWAQHDAPSLGLREKITQRMGGIGDNLERPRGKKTGKA